MINTIKKENKKYYDLNLGLQRQDTVKYEDVNM